MEPLDKKIQQGVMQQMDSMSNMAVPFHLHNGWDNPQLDPAISLLGFPVVQVANASVAPTDVPLNGTFRFQVDITPTYYLWAYLTYSNAAVLTGAWKQIGFGTNATTKSVIATKDLSDASGSQVIAHGLGRIPVYSRATAYYTDGTHAYSLTGTYDGTTQQYSTIYGGAAGALTTATDSTTFIILHPSSGNYQTATIAVDITNATLTWTKTGSPTGSVFILLEFN